MDTAMTLRSKILQAEEISFTMDITADYGDRTQSFSMQCSSDSRGDVTFVVMQPETISGISGRLTGEGGSLLFDDVALHFPLLAEERLTPVSTPWILVKTLRSGYLTSACTEDQGIRISINDRYEEDALQLDIWLNGDALPESIDILYDGKRILSAAVKDFVIV